MNPDESTFRILVNGALLSQFKGQNVLIFGTVNGAGKGSEFDIITTDKHVVTITLRKPLSETITGLVQIHGIVRDKNTVLCDYHMVFPPEIASTYDAEVTNDAVKIIHSIPNVWTKT